MGVPPGLEIRGPLAHQPHDPHMPRQSVPIGCSLDDINALMLLLPRRK